MGRAQSQVPRCLQGLRISTVEVRLFQGMNTEQAGGRKLKRLLPGQVVEADEDREHTAETG